MIYPVYVISHSDLFREGLNAVAAFCGSRGFQAAIWTGSAFGIVLTAVFYLKRHDLVICLHWLVTYVFVFSLLLGIPSTVAIHNTSDPTIPPKVIDNVPFGIAFPAYLVTSIAYGFTVDMETVFAMPEDVQYHKTGMLFGSSLFLLSMAASIDNQDLMESMNQYVKNCVIGDVFINHKYSWDDLAEASDLWGLMSSNASAIRGLFISGKFLTCHEAAKRLTHDMHAYAKDRAPNFLSRFIPAQHPYSAVAVNRLITSSYQYFMKQSRSATDILRQNLAINAFRQSISNYARETGSLVSLPMMANTEAMSNLRMAWGTSRHIGIQTLPLMQIVLLLLLLCLFPLVAILTLLPSMGINVFKQYIYSLLWVETWPILYAILNMVMNFYLHGHSVDSVTLSNINLLAQSHSDIASIAGYLVLAIPFLSFGIVRGMAFTFNNAAQYLGGMMHSIAQGNAAAVASGNYALGNVSTDNATANNLNANKHDTNFSNMQGMMTQQLSNGALMTTTASGEHIINISPAMSHIASSLQAADNIHESLSKQVNESLSSAYRSTTQYADSKSHSNTLSENFSDNESTQLDQAMNTITSITNQVAQREGAKSGDTFQKLTQAALSGGLTGTVGIGGGSGMAARPMWDAKLSAGANVLAQGSSTHQGSYDTDVNRDISASEAKNFNKALNSITNYAKNHSFSDQNSDTENLVIQTGAELSEAQSLSRSAQFVESHADSVNTNFTQAFSDYVRKELPHKADEILSATGNSELLVWQKALANEFIQRHAKELTNQFAADSVNVQQGDYSGSMKHSKDYLKENYQQQSDTLTDKAKDPGVDYPKADSLKNSVAVNIQQNQHRLQHDKQAQGADRANLENRVAGHIKKEENYAKAGVTRHIFGGVKE